MLKFTASTALCEPLVPPQLPPQVPLCSMLYFVDPVPCPNQIKPTSLPLEKCNQAYHQAPAFPMLTLHHSTWYHTAFIHLQFSFLLYSQLHIHCPLKSPQLISDPLGPSEVLLLDSYLPNTGHAYFLPPPNTIMAYKSLSTRQHLLRSLLETSP